jgi:hypothetical protein
MDTHDIEIQAHAPYGSTAELVIRCSCQKQPLDVFDRGAPLDVLITIAREHLAVHGEDYGE